MPLRAHRSLLLVTALGLCIPALTPSAGAITGGTADGAAHASAGALVYPGSTFPICSGTLVPSRAYRSVFLTAAHCLTGSSGRSLSGVRVRVTFDPIVAPTSRFYSGTYYGDPYFSPSAPDPRDLAVVVFGSAPPRLPAVPLAPAGSAGKAQNGTLFAAVGYGLPALGVRQHAVEEKYDARGVWLYLKPHDGGPACDVDSGGPDLLTVHGVTYVAATTNGGDATCLVYDQSYRVDTSVAARYVNARH